MRVLIQPDLCEPDSACVQVAVANNRGGADGHAVGGEDLDRTEVAVVVAFNHRTGGIRRGIHRPLFIAEKEVRLLRAGGEGGTAPHLHQVVDPEAIDVRGQYRRRRGNAVAFFDHLPKSLATIDLLPNLNRPQPPNNLTQAGFSFDVASGLLNVYRTDMYLQTTICLSVIITAISYKFWATQLAN